MNTKKLGGGLSRRSILKSVGLSVGSVPMIRRAKAQPSPVVESTNGPQIDASNEERLQAIELVPTLIKGVFNYPPVPRGFDITVATEQIRNYYGFFMPPKTFHDGDLWREILSNPKNRVYYGRKLPARLPPGLLAPAIAEPSQMQGGDIGTDRWSGCALANPAGKWIQVSAQWAAPRAFPAEQINPALLTDSITHIQTYQWNCGTWVGLDGLTVANTVINTKDVWQAGVIVTVPDDGQPATYQPFYEWAVADPSLDRAAYPWVDPTPIPLTVSAGDICFVNVAYAQDSQRNVGGNVLFMNMTTKRYFGPSFLKQPSTAKAQGQTAEWIVELTAGANGALPSFGTVTFSDVSADMGSRGPFADLTKALNLFVTEIPWHSNRPEQMTAAGADVNNDTVGVTYLPVPE